jgi:hypothetical protein
MGGALVGAAQHAAAVNIISGAKTNERMRMPLESNFAAF